MKKIIVMMALLVSVVNLALATDDENINAQVKRTFVQQFPGAEYAKWQKLDDEGIYMVRFVYKDKALLSYINEEGELLATVRSLQPENIPFLVSETLSRKYKGYKISKVEEFITDSDVSYLFNISNDRVKVFVRIYNSGFFYEIRREKRKAGTGNPLL